MWKPIIAAVTVVIGASPAFAGYRAGLAGTNTAEAFEELYSSEVDGMSQEGVRPTTRCWPDYCATFMINTHGSVTLFISRNVLQSGEENRQVCFGNQTARICRFSTGLIVEQAYTDDQWIDTLTIARTFDAPAPPAPPPALSGSAPFKQAPFAKRTQSDPVPKGLY